ncbi:glycogen binding subunit 70E [Arctopsyche grandis]|uniref:glycogen binding subunit 70E n=1 Tax=Arctopsyche grandis TaxID=121162 RepID=UPI00406D6FA1
MLASHGFPSYGHSPPGGFLMEYAPTHPCRVYGRRPLPTRNSSPCLPFKAAGVPQTPRPCLRPDAPSPPARIKKRVVFADDQGLSLTQVRVMWEPSDVPPHWSLHSTPAVTSSLPNWELGFAQPASDYVDFRRRINDDNVSLENVIIKAKDGFLTGTVKVKNLDFHKEVVVRWSADNWVTSEDAFCTYVDVPVSSAGAYSIYDTFSFKVLLPVVSNYLAFCVCFRCQGKEYWDSNGGTNYKVSKRGDVSRSESPPPAVSAPSKNSVAYQPPALWSEYAAWHGPCDVPYW